MNETVAQQNQKPWPAYIIVGSVFGVILLGWILSPTSEGGKLAWIDLLGTTNHGELLNPPVEVQPEQILDASGSEWVGMQDNTWKLLLFSPEICAEHCLDRLEQMHAMRLRLNRDMSRLTIGLVMPMSASMPSVDLHQDIHLLRLSDTELIQALDATNVTGWQGEVMLALMNPIDVFMLAYRDEHTGVGILEDFEHLLELAH